MNSVIVSKGHKKTSMATCKCSKTGKFEIRVNRVPLAIIEDKLLKAKFDEIIQLLGVDIFHGIDFDISIPKSSGSTGRIYAARQALCRSLLVYYSKYSDEVMKENIKKSLMDFDRYILVVDKRKKEAKKYGGPGARARYQKSYR